MLEDAAMGVNHTLLSTQLIFRAPANVSELALHCFFKHLPEKLNFTHQFLSAM